MGRGREPVGPLHISAWARPQLLPGLHTPALSWGVIMKLWVFRHQCRLHAPSRQASRCSVIPPFPGCSYPRKWPHVSFGEGAGPSSPCSLAMLLVLLSLRIQPALQPRGPRSEYGSGLETGQRRGTCHASTSSILAFFSGLS